MCKVLIIPRISDKTRPLISEFVDLMAIRMSQSNSDGLGYAATDRNGNLFGERWLVNSDFWSAPKPAQEDVIAKLFSPVTSQFKYQKENYGEASEPGEYTRFGAGFYQEDATALTLHARMATSSKGHNNTHPFYDEAQDTSLIHNGVIRNVDEFDLKLSTCDSEAILISYLKNKVNSSSTNIQAMANSLVGYYVAALFSRDAEGKRILDIATANNSNLSVVWVPDFDTYVFSTSHADITFALDSMGLDRVGLRDIASGSFIRLNPETGDVLEVAKFEQGKPTGVATTSTNTRRTEANNWRAPAATDSGKFGKQLSAELIEYFKLAPEIEALPTGS